MDLLGHRLNFQVQLELSWTREGFTHPITNHTVSLVSWQVLSRSINASIKYLELDQAQYNLWTWKHLARETTKGNCLLEEEEEEEEEEEQGCVVVEKGEEAEEDENNKLCQMKFGLHLWTIHIVFWKENIYCNHSVSKDWAKIEICTWGIFLRSILTKHLNILTCSVYTMPKGLFILVALTICLRKGFSFDWWVVCFGRDMTFCRCAMEFCWTI